MVQNNMSKIRTILSQHEQAVTSFGGFYSPGLRFLPEDDDPESGSTEEEVISEADKEAAVKHEKEIEVEKQKSQQHEANARKQKERADNAQAALDASTTQHETDKAELDRLTKLQAKREDAEIPDLDPEDFEETGEKTLVKTINALKAKTKADAAELKEEIKSLNKTKGDLLKQQKADKVATQRTQQYNELLDTFDGIHGHEHRNAAVNAFNALVTDGKVRAGAAQATIVMNKCYLDAVKAAKGTKKKGFDEVVLDSGRGGGDTTRLSNVKLTKGVSLDEAAAQAEKMLTESSP